MHSVLKRNFEVFSGCDWLAALTAHIPNAGEHLVRYYGWYSNVNRGKRRKTRGEERTPIEDFNEALRLEPKNPGNGGIYLVRGTTYLELGDWVHGCRDIQTACELGECGALAYDPSKVAKEVKQCRAEGNWTN
jgi:hypothetical protein